MRNLLYATGAVVALATALAPPVAATLLFSIDVDGVNVARYVDNCAASATCPGGDQNPAVGTIALNPTTFAGNLILNGSVQSSVGTPANPNPLNILNSSSLNIINNTAGTRHIQAAVGDTSFAAPVSSASASASGTVQTGAGSSFTYTFFNDPENSQGADNATDGPGAAIDTFAFTATDPLADAFSHASGSLAVSDLAPFSMTQTFDAMLTAGGQLVGNSQTEIKSPPAVAEPGSLILLGTALLGLGIGHRWTRRQRRGNNLASA
jgi:hypothetical protein